MATDEADAALEVLAAAKDRWARLPVARKIEYLDRLSREVLAAAEDWVAAAVRGKRIPPASPLVGEEWISGPYAVLAWIAAARDTLRAVAAGRSPLDGFEVWERPDGQAVVRVFPHGLKEQLLLHGYTVDVRMQPGVTAAALPDTVATFYKRPDPAGPRRARPRRRQHRLDPAARPPLQALRRGRGRAGEAQPDQRLPPPRLRARLRPARRRRLPALRLRRRRGRRPPLRAPRRGERPHHRQRAHARPHRLRGGRGGRGAAGARRARAVQADQLRARRRRSRPSSSRAPGGRPTSTTRRSTSPPRSSTTAATTASPRRCWCCRPAGRGATGCWTPCAGGCERPWTGRPTTAAAPSGSTPCSSATRRRRRWGPARTRGSWSATSTPPSRPPTRSPRSSSPRCWRPPPCRPPIPRTSCSGRWRSATRRCTGRSGRTC